MHPPRPQPKLSVVIPTLDEAAALPGCLRSLQTNAPEAPETEIIVSDGGSLDSTLRTARNHPAKIVHAPAGRASQMNAGARVASGDTLLFLHADTTLPAGACRSVVNSTEAGFSMGCFERRFSGAGEILKRTSAWAGWRARKTFWVYGDQAMFIRRGLFERLGGFRPLPRFEDLDLAMRAAKHGAWTVLPGPVTSDSRRFRNGTLRRIAADFLLTVGWVTNIVSK